MPRPDRRRAAASLPTRSTIDVIDNGIGLAEKNRQRLLEPYVDDAREGHGLGLAIVGKIVEEHGGGSNCSTHPTVARRGHGALVRLFLPVVSR